MVSSSWAVLFPTEAEKISFPSSSRETLAIRAIRSAVRMSRWVQVGDLNMTVSDRIAAAIMPAIFSEGMRPRSWNMLAMMVLVEPTGSLRT